MMKRLRRKGLRKTLWSERYSGSPPSPASARRPCLCGAAAACDQLQTSRLSVRQHSSESTSESIQTTTKVSRERESLLCPSIIGQCGHGSRSCPQLTRSVVWCCHGNAVLLCHAVLSCPVVCRVMSYPGMLCR